MNQEERRIAFYKTDELVMEGLSLFQQSIAAPYHAYLVCELVYGEDIDTLAGIEEFVYSIYDTWPDKRTGIHIQKVTLTLEPPYVLLGFTLVFFEQQKEKKLSLFEKWVKRELEEEDTPQQEWQLRRKETQRLIQRMTNLSELVVQTTQEIGRLREDTRCQEKKWTAIYQQLGESPISKHPVKNVHTKWSLFPKDQGRRLDGCTFIWGEKKKETTHLADPVKQSGEPFNELLEAKVIDLFLPVEKSLKVQRVSQKQLINWEKRMEPVSYLWTMIQLNIADDWLIGGELSCQKLVKEFPLVLAELTRCIEKTSMLKYCSKQLIQQVKGYIALVDYFENLLENLNSNSKDDCNT